MCSSVLKYFSYPSGQDLKAISSELDNLGHRPLTNIISKHRDLRGHIRGAKEAFNSNWTLEARLYSTGNGNPLTINDHRVRSRKLIFKSQSKIDNLLEYDIYIQIHYFYVQRL